MFSLDSDKCRDINVKSAGAFITDLHKVKKNYW